MSVERSSYESEALRCQRENVEHGDDGKRRESEREYPYPREKPAPCRVFFFHDDSFFLLYFVKLDRDRDEKIIYSYRSLIQSVFVLYCIVKRKYIIQLREDFVNCIEYEKCIS